VAGDRGDLHDIETLLEQSGGGLVAQVMEPEVLDAGPAHRTDVGALDSLGGDAGEDLAMQAAGQGA
jgi:hypothetical protein